jgi:hypothetical protein
MKWPTSDAAVITATSVIADYVRLPQQGYGTGPDADAPVLCAFWPNGALSSRI